MPAGTYHPIHLREPLLDVLEVADTEGRRHGVERIVGVGQCRAVLLLERDDIRQSRLGYFLLADRHHAGREIGADDLFGVELLGQGDGQVARAGRDVENPARREGAQVGNAFPAPILVDTE